MSRTAGWQVRARATVSFSFPPCSPCPPPRPPAHSAPLPEKSEAQITQEIQAIIRQITASVTFLPLLSDKCEHACTGALPAAREGIAAERPEPC